jgi:hypothetical protein
MRSLSLRTLCMDTWSLYKSHWKVLLAASVIPFVISLLQRFVFDSADIAGSVVALFGVVVGFLSYIYQTMYILEVQKGNTPEWKPFISRITVGHAWRIIRTNIWMVFIIVWPMFVIVAIAGVGGYLLGQNSFTGTTLSLIAMGVAAVVGAILAFVRSLSYTLMLYLAFTTNMRVRTLGTRSREYMQGYRIKLLKVVLLQIFAGIIAALSIVLLPVLQSLVYIMMVLFAERVIAHQTNKAIDHSDSSSAEDEPEVDSEDDVKFEPIFDEYAQGSGSQNEDELKQLYYKLMKQYHPDLAGDDRDKKFRTQLVKKINNAYSEKDLETLRAFDQEV